MKSSVENQRCATHLEKTAEPDHETELTSPPGTALTENPAERSVRSPDSASRQPAATQSKCYEHRQGSAQAEHSSGATHNRPVCERGS
ncbi:hypothetical protein J2W17_002533 [Pseudomonas lini]|jgi:hypothetical protein|nr:hypothetical protein [Pseudomonas lini]